tara:strand:+ start:411 stop:794 length:384 start_codon:yes stop_codon:yes gene_type:complete
VKNVAKILSGVMGQWSFTSVVAMKENIMTYVPTIVSLKQAQDLKEWNRSGMPFDLIPEAQKKNKDYTKLAKQIKVNEFISLTPDDFAKTNKQLQGRAKYVCRLLRKEGKTSSFRKISDQEYRVYRIK